MVAPRLAISMPNTRIYFGIKKADTWVYSSTLECQGNFSQSQYMKLDDGLRLYDTFEVFFSKSNTPGVDTKF